MTIGQTNDFKNAALEGRRDYLDLGSGVARILVYGDDEPRPATGATATGTLLVTLELDKPSGLISAGELTLIEGDDAIVAASGTALWARVINGNGDIAFDCDVSNTAGSAELKLPSTALFAGGTTRLVSGVLR
jgi:hypothetical protein